METFDLDTIDKKTAVTILKHLVQKGDITMKDAGVISQQLKASILDKQQNQLNYTPKEYISFELGFDAYVYILENGGTAQEALEYAATIHNTPEEVVNQAKNLKFYYAKKVVNEADNHPEQKKMVANKTIDRQALKTSTSANMQLTKLSNYKNISDKLEDLENRDIEQQEQIDTLEARVNIHQSEIDVLKKLSGLENTPIKERIKYLRECGCTHRAIAEALRCSVATVKRWDKRNKNET